MVDLAPDVGFRRSWYHWKACATLSLKVLDLQEIELGLERYGPTNKSHRGVFGSLEGNFPVKISARPEKILTIREFHAMSEHVLFLKVMGLRIIFQRDRKNLCASVTSSGGETMKFSTVLFHWSVFARMVDVVPDVGFWQFLYHRKACATYFLKVSGLHRGELGFARCGPANRGRRNVSHAGGSSSDRDSSLTGGALDDPRVTRCR